MMMQKRFEEKVDVKKEGVGSKKLLVYAFLKESFFKSLTG